jgi:hypothetical protein
VSQEPARPLPAGRHFKRRRFQLQLPSRSNRTAPGASTEYRRPSSAAIPIVQSKEAGDRQFKRRVALILVVLVVLSIPILLAALIFAG